MAYAGSSPSAVIPLVGSQLTYQLGGGVVLPSPRGITSAPAIHATRITTLTSVERRGSNVLRAKPKLLTRIVAGKMQQPAHPQDGGEQQQRQAQAHQQTRQVASPDIGPGWQRGRHQQFMGAPGEIPPHAISCDKGRKSTSTSRTVGSV